MGMEQFNPEPSTKELLQLLVWNVEEREHFQTQPSGYSWSKLLAVGVPGGDFKSQIIPLPPSKSDADGGNAKEWRSSSGIMACPF